MEGFVARMETFLVSVCFSGCPLGMASYRSLSLSQGPTTTVYLGGETTVYLARYLVFQEWTRVLLMTQRQSSYWHTEKTN